MVMPWELSILDGAHALLLRAKLAIIGDTAITGDLDVSGEIVGGTIPIENLSNVDEQSFENLLDNGDFKMWSLGSNDAPDEWALTGGGASVAQSSVSKINQYSAAMTRSGATCYLSSNVLDYTRYAGRVVSIAVLVKTSVANQIKLQVYDGVSSNVSGFHTGGGDWELIEVSYRIDNTPTLLQLRVISYVDGIAYIDGVNMVEGSICPAFSPKPLSDPHTYGEMYIFNNSNATVIETANTPIALRQISSGLQKGFIFDAGSTAVIGGFSDYSGTVAGAVAVSTAGHGLTTGDIITIRGTTNYNGIFEITVINEDFIYIMDTWVADDGASDWDKGASLTAQAGADGVYTSTWQMTTAPAGACELCFKTNINETPQDKSTACRDMAINDKDNNSSTCLMTIVEDDIIWLSVESDATSNITNSMGNMNLERM